MAHSNGADRTRKSKRLASGSLKVASDDYVDVIGMRSGQRGNCQRRSCYQVRFIKVLNERLAFRLTTRGIPRRAARSLIAVVYGWTCNKQGRAHCLELFVSVAIGSWDNRRREKMYLSACSRTLGSWRKWWHPRFQIKRSSIEHISYFSEPFDEIRVKPMESHLLLGQVNLHCQIRTQHHQLTTEQLCL